ncbi:MAG: TRAP transporter substrate-binding protein [Desulfuromonadaceae bacterium]|nr:TRAP transporter substrate-binding protein [Desulfuromonadaceae bacterium]
MKPFKTRMILAVTAVLLGTVIAGAASDVIVLKVAHPNPPNSTANKLLVTPWCNKINKESNGRLKCQIYPSMSLGGTPSQLFDQARDGVADVIWTIPTYQAGRFIKTEVFELPFMTINAEKGSPALWEYIQKNSLDEFKGTKLIFAHLHDGTQIQLKSKSIKSLEDFNGLKLRAPTRIGSQIVAALGAIPVQMPVPSVPEAVSKGVVDGAMLPWEIMTAFKMQEIAKVHVETPPDLPKVSNSIFVMAMNKAKYDSLSPELRKVIDNNSGLEESKWAGKVFGSTTEPGRKIAQDRHNTFIAVSPAEYKRWVKATENVDDAWIKEADAKGANGKALLNDAKTLLDKYSK